MLSHHRGGSLERIMSTYEDESAEDSAVQDFLQILEEHRKNCERQGKYVEAEIAKNRLEELKLDEENRKREAMRSRQIAERLGVEEAHMLEFQQFNIVWDKKMQDYEERAALLEEETKARHAQELANFQKQMIESISNKPKFSKELLSLRRVQETLAKSKDYKEAHRYVILNSNSNRSPSHFRISHLTSSTYTSMLHPIILFSLFTYRRNKRSTRPECLSPHKESFRVDSVNFFALPSCFSVAHV